MPEYYFRFGSKRYNSSCAVRGSVHHSNQFLIFFYPLDNKPTILSDSERF